MKTIVAILLCSLTIYSLPAMADCTGEVTAVLDAMRAAGPIRREMEFYREGTLETKTVSDFSPPDQLIETANSVQGNYLSTVSVSGKTAWSAMKHAGDPDQPIQEFDGSAYIEEAKTFRMPPYPITECPIDDGELQLVWTASDGERSQKVTAKAEIGRAHV